MSAIISDCGKYRYRLDREIGPCGFPSRGPKVVWIMVNPSTADANIDDATIRKVTSFTEKLGGARFVVGNLFAYRATDIREFALEFDPIGTMNDANLYEIIAEADILIFAWGSAAKLPAHLRLRFLDIVQLAEHLKKTPQCLGVCKDGMPRHPLMLPYKTNLSDWPHNV